MFTQVVPGVTRKFLKLWLTLAYTQQRLLVQLHILFDLRGLDLGPIQLAIALKMKLCALTIDSTKGFLVVPAASNGEKN